MNNLFIKSNLKSSIASPKLLILLHKWSYSISNDFIWEEFTPKLMKSIEKKRMSHTLQCLIDHSTCFKRSGFARKEKKYVLSMFPYPSGNLHMGHVRVYTTADAMARFYNMQGYKVIHPIGWDAFGLPAENAAMERGKNPTEWTDFNINNMKKQLNSLGFCFDWSSEITTCDPKYYKWTQLLFLKLYQAGLAYKQEAVVNWDPIDKTVLANEQVNAKGISWRSGAKVEKKLLSQWFIKTSRYSKDLYNDLQKLPRESWEMVSAIQRHWIGECDGYTVELKLFDFDHNNIKNYNKFPVWISKIEHLPYVSFLAIPSGHFLDYERFFMSEHNQIKVLNVFAKEPISQNLIPIIVCDDLDYAQSCQVYCGIPLLNVKDKNICAKCKLTENNYNVIDDWILKSSCKSSVRDRIFKEIANAGCEVYFSSSKLKDWLISRQRYWGTPIPIVYCSQCGTVPVSEEDLPVILPEIKGFIVKGAAILQEAKEWYHCCCPRCGKSAVRETDTMDTFVDSSWYFLRFLDVYNDKQMVSKEKADFYLPIDLYIGGKEHAELHLYYARFICKFLKEHGLISYGEPFHKLLTLAVVKSKSYQVVETGKYLAADEVDFSVSPPVEKSTNAALRVKFEKMSKSKYNGVDPHCVVDEFGVDATRLNILTNNDPRMDIKWSDEDMPGSINFLEKVYFYVKSLALSRVEGLPQTPKISVEEIVVREKFLSQLRDNYILCLTHHYENCQFLHVRQNLQKMLNETVSAGQIMLLNDEYERCIRAMIIMLSPICPNLCQELWERLKFLDSLPEVDSTISVLQQDWPSVSSNYPINIDCQVNFVNVCQLTVPYSEFSSLDQNSAIVLVKKCPEIIDALRSSELAISDTLFNSAEISPAVNFLTMSREDIKRDVDVEVKNNFICTIQVPQDDYETLNEKKVTEILRNNSKFKRAMEGLVIKSCKLNFIPNGRSKVRYSVKQRK